ncbi:Chalcone subgroup, partial [Globisporangium splendens]
MASVRRSEVSTAINDTHYASFSSSMHSLHHGGGSSMSMTSSISASAATVNASSLYTGTILMQGKLMRRDRTFLTWKWRDFTLERNRLQYFSEKGNRKGEIILTPTTPITIRLLSEPKPYGFLLFIKDEKLTLAAQNENEQRKWIDVFCDVFHASVEQVQNDKGDRRTRPTFLPIPDISKAMKEKQQSGSSNGAVNGGSTTETEGGGFNEVIPILESRMTYGPMKESYSRVTFPPSLANGDLLVGVGPIVRRMGWTDERILAVGMYIDPEGASKELENFHGRTVKSLYGDQGFYDHLMVQSTFRRSFVITSRKRVSKSVLTALLHDEIAPRIGTAKDGLDTFLGFIEKSLKKAESMVLRINPDGQFEYRLRGQLYPPIASPALCKCIQALFFDVNSIQHDAKRGLIERLPSLWGGEVLDVQDEIFGRVSSKAVLESESEYDDDDDDEVGDGDDDAFYDDEDDYIEEGDEEEEEEEGGGQVGEETGRPSTRKSVYAERKSRRSSMRKRNISLKEELDDQDEREHELMRRESRRIIAHFGPLLDPDSNVHFSGDLLMDGSALLGTWSQQIAVPPNAYDHPYDGQTYRFSVGLYVEPGAASENLLKYKGLSVGSIVQDPDFFARFAQGSFQKHLVFKVDSKLRLHTLIEFFDTHLKQLASGPGSSSLPTTSQMNGAPTNGRASASSTESKSNESFLEVFDEYKHKQILPKDEIRFSIEADGKMTLCIRKRASVVKDSDAGEAESSSRNDVDIPLPPPPFAMLFQSIFYGFHTIDAASRAQLMQRLPNLLDLAKDDLVHTYHDEIQVLKENYKRQKPENRVKVGYLAISFEKKKITKTIDGAKEPTAVPSRWSKRWCRLDGVMFSYFSHKRSRKARDVMDLTQCEVSEITSFSGPEVAPFAIEKDTTRPSIKIAITKPNGEILALRTESIYEGEEWLESLTDASKVRRRLSDAAPPAQWENNIARLRRSSSVYRSLRGVSSAQLEQLKSQNTGEGGEHDPNRSLESSTANTDDDEYEAVDGDDSSDEGRVVIDKEGSLVAWVQEDPRHAVILGLLAVILWLVMSNYRLDASTSST